MNISKLYILIILCPILTRAQIINENFDYSTGKLTDLSSLWSESPDGSVDIQIKDGNLAYLNYPSSNIGRNIGLNGGGSRSGALISFPSISSDGSTIYASFLMVVTSTSDLDSNITTGGYFAAFRDTASLSAKRAYVYLRKGSSDLKYSIGLAKTSSSSLTWFGSELDVDTTYLIVTNYIFQSGSDAVKMWINPNLSGTEPAEDIIVTSGTDATSLGGYQFLQRVLSGDEDIDGLRVATSWSLAPLPVELTSFRVYLCKNYLILKWQTATEVNNYGFDIERAALNKFPQFNWERIGFIKGHGNSNSIQNYNFKDSSPPCGELKYRLKQIDTDGKFEYSKTVSIKIPAPIKIELFQNYPNPFNPETHFSFSLPNPTNINLSIYNTLGENILTVAKGLYGSGIHTITFSSSSISGGLSSGIYFYRLVTSENILVRKMLIIK